MLKAQTHRTWCCAALLAQLLFLSSCGAFRQAQLSKTNPDHPTSPVAKVVAAKPAQPARASLDPLDVEEASSDVTDESGVTPVEFENETSLKNTSESTDFHSIETYTETIDELVSIALLENSRLQKVQQQAAASWDRVPQVESLPDPILGINAFGSPIETAAGSQQANMSFSQKIPSLKRLDANGQKVAYESLAMDELLRSEQLRVMSEVRVGWGKLYIIAQEIRLTEENQTLLKELIKVATLRVGQGKASQGDVLLATLEMSRLEEELLRLRQRQVSTIARINQLLNRDAEFYLAAPLELPKVLPAWDLVQLRQVAFENQPEIEASRLRTNATTWGVEAATLARVPDLTFNVNWYAIDDNRPASTVVDVGRDAWSVGANLNIPLWRDKYDAIESEATRKHYAARAETEELKDKYGALLADLLDKGKTASETMNLYENTILPQAQQTLQADQLSYSQGIVEFDRVIRDFQSLLTLEKGYHRAIGNIYIAIAQLKRTTGSELNPLP